MQTQAQATKPMIPFRVQLWGQLLQGKIALEFRNSPIEGIKFLFPGGEAGVETDEIKLEPVDLVERKKRLQQLLMNGKIPKTVILGDDIEVVMETRSVGDAMEASLLPKDWELPKGVTDKWAGTFDASRTLASAIVSYAGKSIGETPREKYEFVVKLPEPVFAYLVDEYNSFLAELRDLVTPKVLGVVLPKS